MRLNVWPVVSFPHDCSLQRAGTPDIGVFWERNAIAIVLGLSIPSTHIVAAHRGGQQ